jgi:hypothetical protein
MEMRLVGMKEQIINLSLSGFMPTHPQYQDH